MQMIEEMSPLLSERLLCQFSLPFKASHLHFYQDPLEGPSIGLFMKADFDSNKTDQGECRSNHACTFVVNIEIFGRRFIPEGPKGPQVQFLPRT
jgi:hypothetical protein